MLASHEIHNFLPAFIQLLIGLPRILAVSFAHLAQIFILNVEGVHLFLHDIYFLFVVSIHLHGEIAGPIDCICALLHKDDLFLQLLHFSLVFLQLLDCGLVASLGVAFLFAVGA
jgi:hypothetical protein